MRIIFAIVLLVGSFACWARNIDLPPNVTLRPSGSRSGDFIDTVTQEIRGAEFVRVKLCIAEAVSNREVVISGGTDAPFTFASSNRTQANTVGGGDVFKYVDDDQATLIAAGNVDGGPAILSREVVRFEVRVTAGPERVVLRWHNIERTTLDTGSVTNSGFQPVGAWRGAKPLRVLEALEGLGRRIDACLQ